MAGPRPVLLSAVLLIKIPVWIQVSESQKIRQMKFVRKKLIEGIECDAGCKHEHIVFLLLGFCPKDMSVYPPDLHLEAER